ncbi:hypothetical protein ANO11243_041840 [Dothideomycetidae sp. 11243]|nr:hypothetical protein ANO11243_041840 [fungal sp. No.11243]
MRTSVLIASALAATALAKPLEKREVVVTEIDVVYTTDIVYVTAGQSAAAAATQSTADSKHHHSSAPAAPPAPATTQATTQAPVAPAPAPVAPTSSQAPPPPVETSSAPAASQVSSHHHLHHHRDAHHQSPAHPFALRADSESLERRAAAKKPVVKSTTTTKKAPSPTIKAAIKPTTAALVKTTPKTIPKASITTTAKAATKTSAKPTSSGGTASTYQQAVVDHHNYHRANHSSPAIAWDQGLADTAMSIAKTCVYAHKMDASSTPYGQNIAAGVGASDIGRTISDLFYNGEVSKFTGYGQAQPDMSGFEGWGHFSQIVWAASTKVGCATWDCNTQGLANFQGPCTDGSAACNNFFTVCNFSPPGNVEGEYGSNIGNSLNDPTITGSYQVDTSAIGSSYGGSTGQGTY